jgi:hypothetical protein
MFVFDLVEKGENQIENAVRMCRRTRKYPAAGVFRGRAGPLGTWRCNKTAAAQDAHAVPVSDHHSPVHGKQQLAA